jgi:hypothetical protein
MFDLLERHNIIRPELMEQALSVLKREIVAELTDNHRFAPRGTGYLLPETWTDQVYGA